MKHVAAALVPLVVFLSACSSSSSQPDTTPDAAVAAPDAEVTCASDPRAQTYAANLVQPGKAKVFTMTLVSADPAPPARGNNTWTMKLADASGAPVSGASVDASPFMPDHGHGPTVRPTVTANADGTLTVAPLSLFMPGLWQVTFTVTAGAATDTIVYAFCVAG